MRRSTLLRLIHAAPDPDSGTPLVLGVDDFAPRKRHVYGTVLVNIETRRPVEVIPERSAESFRAALGSRFDLVVPDLPGHGEARLDSPRARHHRASHPVVAGVLVDRLGPRRVVAAGNFLSAMAFLGYLFVDSLWQLIAAALVASVGQATFWTATRVLVGVVAGTSRRADWFALQNTTRNLGYGLGAMAGAVAVSQGGRIGYLCLAALNAASYLIAGLLVLRANVSDSSSLAAPTASAPVHEEPTPSPRQDYRRLLTDRGLLLISGINMIFVLCTSVLSVLLAVYLNNALQTPVWLGGALFAVDTALVIITQAVITRRAAGHDRVRVLTIAAGTFAVSFAVLGALASAPRWLIIPGLFVAVAIFAVAGMLQGPIINAVAVDLAPAQAAGKYLAVYQLSWSLGGGIAPALLSWLLTLNTKLPWITLIAACGFAVQALHTTPIAPPRTSPPVVRAGMSIWRGLVRFIVEGAGRRPGEQGAGDDGEVHAGHAPAGGDFRGEDAGSVRADAGAHEPVQRRTDPSRRAAGGRGPES